jgi:hypothetical protein
MLPPQTVEPLTLGGGAGAPTRSMTTTSFAGATPTPAAIAAAKNSDGCTSARAGLIADHARHLDRTTVAEGPLEAATRAGQESSMTLDANP